MPNRHDPKVPPNASLPNFTFKDGETDTESFASDDDLLKFIIGVAIAAAASGIVLYLLAIF